MTKESAIQRILADRFNKVDDLWLEEKKLRTLTKEELIKIWLEI